MPVKSIVAQRSRVSTRIATRMAALTDGTSPDSPDLAPLVKDNRGYNLTQLLIGAEGTLGFVTAAALVSENKVLCHPSSVDSIPSSAGREDHVSMGMTAALKARRVVENVRTCLAIELMVAAQALDLAALGIPAEDDYIALYCQRTGFTTPEAPITVLYRPARQAWLRELEETARARPALATAPAPAPATGSSTAFERSRRSSSSK